MSKKCFFICPIGDDGSDIREHSDTVLNELIKPVCDKLDIDVIRSDLENTTNRIDEDMFNHLDHDDLAIADLTNHNPNVFYETGYRYAKGLPIIHIAEKGTTIPFDIASVRTIFYNFDIRNVGKFKNNLEKTIESALFTRTGIDNKNTTEVTQEYSDSLSKECRNFLRLLYIEYLYRKKKGSPLPEASYFGSFKDLSKLLNTSLENVKRYTSLLRYAGYLCCISDNRYYLAAEGILYGKDNFNESSSISALRLILNKCNQLGDDIDTSSINVDSDDVEILEELGYIKVVFRYIDGSYSIRLTEKAFEFERNET